MIEETLSTFQKEFIKKRLKLDFNQELEKSKTEFNRKSFNKIFRDELDILIQRFFMDGIQFYGFTIDLLFLKKNNIENWKDVHEYIEDWINWIGSEIELIEFSYFSIELHKRERLKKRKIKKSPGNELVVYNGLDGMPHLHGIIGIRTILGHNDNLDIAIKDIFKSFHQHEDIKINKLYQIKDVKKYWNYVIKENNFRFHRFVQYSSHLNYIKIYGSIADLELIYDDNDRYAFELQEWKNSKTCDVSGVKSNKPSSKTLIVYLLNLFLWHKNYKINNNKIYQQIPDTKYSWTIIDNTEALKKNNITIFEYLKKIYPQQLDGINTMEIINKDWNSTIEEIIENNQYLSQIEFKKDVLEFKDGMYFINENKFFYFRNKKNEIDIRMKGKNCCVYFDRSYNNIKKPEIWLKSIEKTVVNSENFCIDLARYFHSDALDKLKQKSLLIVGGSNTGKTTLVTNIIVNLFGKENIGMIGKGDNFILEQLEGKDVIIADEFKYSSSNRSSLLKLMGNELDLINKKGLKKYEFQNKAPVLFMFNSDLNNLMLNDDAFKNRYIRYEFKHEIKEYLSNIDEILKKELAQIIIYCNKLYF